MSSHNEQVKPVAFDLADTPSGDTPNAKTNITSSPGVNRWVFPALFGLLAIAIVVVFWLPGRIAPGDPTPIPEAVEAAAAREPVTAASPSSAPAGEEASPWSDAQMAKLRKEAQDVLGELLQAQAALEEMSVERWAGEEFEQAIGIATTGDLQYRDRKFVEARESYQQALEALSRIQDSAADIFADHLEQARLAIESGSAEDAAAALEIATTLDADNEQLAALQARLATLDEVMQALAGATQAETSGDLATAEAELERALALDPDHQRVAQELERTRVAHIAARFNDAMSDGYQALDEQQFDQARSKFREAESLAPGSAEAASALQEVSVAKTDYTLAGLKNQGSRSETRESWADAVKAYEAALAIDGTLVFAREGLERTRVRARLDDQFTKAINSPERLTNPEIAATTARLTEQAQSYRRPGTKLDQQLSQLEKLLKDAATPISVTLRSDQQTEVVVYKVARLGQFQQRELSLRPGTYTAVGSRNGFRDVRQTFTLSHGQDIAAVTIICTEQI